MGNFWDTVINWFDSYVVFISAVRAMANIAIFYVFYTKNEIVQDGLIKIYVAEENNGIATDITPEEWS